MTSTRQHGHRPRSSKHPLSRCAGPTDGTVGRYAARALLLSLQHQHPLSEQSRSLCAAVRSHAHARVFHRTRAAASRAC
eukprot:4098526-Prymnesium_polylepis.1